MSKEAQLIQRYLQNECSDYWSVKEINGVIECYFINEHRFSVFKNDCDDWCITGTELYLNMTYNIAILLQENL